MRRGGVIAGRTRETTLSLRIQLALNGAGQENPPQYIQAKVNPPQYIQAVQVECRQSAGRVQLESAQTALFTVQWRWSAGREQVDGIQRAGREHIEHRQRAGRAQVECRQRADRAQEERRQNAARVHTDSITVYGRFGVSTISPAADFINTEYPSSSRFRFTINVFNLSLCTNLDKRFEHILLPDELQKAKTTIKIDLINNKIYNKMVKTNKLVIRTIQS